MARLKNQYMVNIDCGLTFDGEYYAWCEYVETDSDVSELLAKRHLVDISGLPIFVPVADEVEEFVEDELDDEEVS